jgi:hypothetical protein
MLSSLRRSPRSTKLTVPLTGLTNFTSGCNLSTNKASPAFTTSPSLQTTLGFTPVKSSGTSAYSPGQFTVAVSFVALPLRLTSRPLRNLITFAISGIVNNVYFRATKLQKKEKKNELYMRFSLKGRFYDEFFLKSSIAQTEKDNNLLT